MANEGLRAALLAKGIDIGQLAEAIQVDPKTAERWITQGRQPYRKHRYAAASFLGTDESYLWPQALTCEQVASASESEIITVHPHRWAVPRDIWGRLFSEASEEIGILVYSGTFIHDDHGLTRVLENKAGPTSGFGFCSGIRIVRMWCSAAGMRAWETARSSAAGTPSIDTAASSFPPGR